MKYSSDIHIESSDIKENISFSVLILNFPIGIKQEQINFGTERTPRITNYITFRAKSTSQIILKKEVIEENYPLELKLPERSLYKGWHLSDPKKRNGLEFDETHTGDIYVTLKKVGKIFHFEDLKLKRD
jgi:hypothetical protein